MSRKWERMVQKNKEKMNRQRQKEGKTPLSVDGEIIVRGRSWLFPLALAIAGVLFALTLPPATGSETFSQITISLYFVLALFHFFLRRPYLKVGKSHLSWRTFTGEKTLKATEIAAISFIPGGVSIEGLDKKTRRTFSKVLDLYPMEQLEGHLRQFASANRVPLQDNKRG